MKVIGRSTNLCLSEYSQDTAQCSFQAVDLAMKNISVPSSVPRILLRFEHQAATLPMRDLCLCKIHVVDPHQAVRVSYQQFIDEGIDTHNVPPIYCPNSKCRQN